jgi:hypothetical protein
VLSGLFWSNVPDKFSFISNSGVWEQIPGALLSIPLNRNTTIVFSYSMIVEGLRLSNLGNPLPREGNADTLQVRALINNVPYRLSSSYVSTYDTEERVFLKLANIFTVPLLAKEYNITLQWKKTGTNLAQWLLASNKAAENAFSFYAHADFEKVFSLQESSDAYITNANTWKPLTTNLTFNLIKDTVITINYALVVHPQLSMIIKDRSMDFVTTRALVDGLAYTESSETFGTNAWNPLANSIYNSFRLSMTAGNHSIYLQWKKMGNTFKNWISSPSFLDGFASSRNLIVTMDKIQPKASPVSVDYTREIITPSKTSSAGWTTISRNILGFNLIKESAVVFTYALPVTQYGNPSLDANLWDSLSSVQARLVVDGVGYTVDSGASLTTGSARFDTLFGEFPLVLSAGPHNVYLQWRSDLVKWSTFHDLEGGFAHSDELLTFISSENAQPKISCAPAVKGYENQDLVIDSLNISDIDDALLPGMFVNLNISVGTGDLFFPNLPQYSNKVGKTNGSTSKLFMFTDTIDNINRALKGMVYRSPEYWFGNDLLSFSLSDLENVGFGGTLFDSNSTTVTILFVNLPFTVGTPSKLVSKLVLETDQNGRRLDVVGAESDQLAIEPFSFTDRDLVESFYSLSLSVSCGKILLDLKNASYSDAEFSYPDEYYSPTNSLSFSAIYHVMKDILESKEPRILYTADTTCSNFIHGEILVFNFSDLGTSQTVTRFIAIEFTRDRQAPQISTIDYPRYEVKGVIPVETPITEENAGFFYNATRVSDGSRTVTDGDSSSIAFSNGGLQSKGSDLFVVENEFMRYAFNIQYDSAVSIALKTSSYVLRGVPIHVEFTVDTNGMEVLSQGSNFVCLVNTEMIPAFSSQQGENRFSCLYNATGSSSTVWLKFQWYNTENVLLESNYLPLTVIDSIVLQSVQPTSVLPAANSLLTLMTNAPQLIDSCVFEEKIRVSAYRIGDNLLQCRVPMLNVSSPASFVNVALSTVLNNYKTNSLRLAILPVPAINAAMIESIEFENNFVLSIQGNWEDNLLNEVEFIHCVYDDYLIPVLFHSENSVYCKLSLGKDEISTCCENPTRCSASVLLDNFLMNSISPTCYLDNEQNGDRLLISELEEVTNYFAPSAPSPNNLDSIKFYRINSIGLSEMAGSTCQFTNGEFTNVYSIDDNSFGCLIPNGVKNLISVTTGAGKQIYSTELMINDLPFFYSNSPVAGPSNGGTFITMQTVEGSIPEGQYSCLFDSVVVNATKTGSNAISCYSPPGLTGSVPIKIIFENIFLPVANTLHFTFTGSVEITSISPVAGPLAGSTLVTIIGQGFDSINKEDENRYCIFGTIPAAFQVISDMKAVCYSPSAIATGAVNMYFHLSSSVKVETGLSFTYLAGAFLVSVAPNTISSNGGNEIIISGSGFTNLQPVFCLFNNEMKVAGIVVDSTTISCITPAYTPGRVSLKILTQETADTSNQIDMTFVDPVVVRDLSPSFAIHGKKNKFAFYSPELKMQDSRNLYCSFADSVGSTYLTPNNFVVCEVFVLSKEEQGEILLSVGGIAAHFNSNLTVSLPIFAKPEVSSLSSLVSTFTNEEVLNFTCPLCVPVYQRSQAKIFCRFGVYLTAAMMRSDLSGFSCFTPVLSLPSVEPFGLLIDDLPIETGWNFSLVQKPEILDISPGVGSISGNQEFIISGFNFLPAIETFCLFEGETMMAAQVLNSTNIRCLTPVHVAGAVSVNLLIGGYRIRSSLFYEYESLPKAYSIISNWTVASSVSSIIVAGENFDSEDDYFCLLDGRQFTASYQSDSLLLCEVSLVKEGLNSIRIFSNVHGLLLEKEISVLPRVSVSALVPSSDSVFGGTRISVLGSGFSNYNGVDLICSFGYNSTSKATVISDSALECNVPAKTAVNNYLVVLTLEANNLNISLNAFPFEYTSGVELYDFSPRNGSRADGTIVTIIGANLCEESVYCLFGETTSVPLEVKCETVKCLPPPLSNTQKFGLQVKGVNYYFPESFTSENSIILSSFNPSSVILSSDETVSVLVEVQDPLPESIQSLRCFYNREIIPALLINSSFVSCFISSPTLGGNSLGLVIDGVTYFNDELSFKVMQRPVLLEVSTHVITLGSIGNLTITGNQFPVNEQKISCFIQDSIFPAIVASENEVICLIDSSSFRQIDSEFGISISDRWNISFPGSLTISAAVSFDSVNKNELNALENINYLVISGSNFPSDTSYHCLLNDRSFVGRWVSDTSIDCYFVDVFTGDYQLGLLIGEGFYFDAEETVSFVDIGEAFDYAPKGGYANGETVITIWGKNFAKSNNWRCYFDGLDSDGWYDEALPVQGDLNELACITPTRTPGVVAFSLKYNDFTLTFNSSSNPTFTFFSPPEILSVYPRIVSYEGFEELEITGNNFFYGQVFDCVFMNEFVSQAHVETKEIITCSVPFMNITGPVSLSLDYASRSTPGQEIILRVVEVISIRNIQMNYYSELNGNAVSVSGEHFPIGSEVICSFGEIKRVDGTVLNDTNVLCPFDELSELHHARLSLNFEGYVVDSEITPRTTRATVITEVTPKVLPNSMKTTLTVTGSGFNLFDIPKCWFGSVSVIATVINDTTVTCDSPDYLFHGLVPFSLENELTEKDSSIMLNFVNLPVIENIFLSARDNRTLKLTITGNNFNNRLTMDCFMNGTTEQRLKIIDGHRAVCTLQWSGRSSLSNMLSVRLSEFDAALAYKELSSLTSVQSMIYSVAHSVPANRFVAFSFLANTSALPTDLKCVLNEQTYETAIVSEDTVQCQVWSGMSQLASVSLTSAVEGVIGTFSITVLPELQVFSAEMIWESNIAELIFTLLDYKNLALEELNLNWHCSVNGITYAGYLSIHNTISCKIPRSSLCLTDTVKVGYDDMSVTSSEWVLEEPVSCQFIDETGMKILNPSYSYYNQSYLYSVGVQLQKLSKKYSTSDGTSRNYSLDHSTSLTFVDSAVSSQVVLKSNFMDGNCNANEETCLISTHELLNSSEPLSGLQSLPSATSLPLKWSGPLIVDTITPKVVSDFNATWVTVSGRNFAYDAKCVLDDQNVVPSVVVTSSMMNCLIPPMTRNSNSVLFSITVQSMNRSTNFASANLIYDLAFRTQFKKFDFSVYSSFLDSLNSTLSHISDEVVCLSKYGCDFSANNASTATNSSPFVINPWLEIMKMTNSSLNATSPVYNMSFFSNTSVDPQSNKIEIFSVYPVSCAFPCDDVWIRFQGGGFDQSVHYCLETLNTTESKSSCQMDLHNFGSLFCSFPVDLRPGSYPVQLLSNCESPVFETSIEVLLDDSLNTTEIHSDLAALRTSIALPQISYIFPTFGWTSGGTNVRLTGENLDSNLFCMFDLSAANNREDVMIVNASVDRESHSIYCRTFGASKSAKSTVSLILNDGSIQQTGFQFKFNPEPIWYRAQLSTSSNNSLEVIGSGFSAYHQAFCQVIYQDNTSIITSGNVYSDTEIVCNQVNSRLFMFITAVSLSFNGLDFSSRILVESPLFTQQKQTNLTLPVVVSESSIRPVSIQAVENELTFLQLNELNPPTVAYNCTKSNLISFSLEGIPILDTNYSCSVDNRATLMSKLDLFQQKLCYIEPQSTGHHEIVLTSLNQLHAPLKTILICEPDPKVFSISLLSLHADNHQQLSTFIISGFNFKETMKMSCQMNDQISTVVVDSSHNATCSFNFLAPGTNDLAIVYANKVIFSVKFCLTERLLQNGGSVAQLDSGSICVVDEFGSPEVPEQVISYPIRSVVPSSGIFLGNTVIKIIADQISYDDTITCQFGDLNTPALVAGNDYVLCKSPSHTVGSVPLKLFSADDQSKVWCCSSFYYHPFLIMDNIEPKSITGAEGAIVILSIQNLKEFSFDLYCHVNGFVASGAFLEENKFSCALPAIYSPIANISLGSATEIWSNTLQATVLRPTGIFTFTPMVGTIFGGTTVRITLPLGFRLISTPFCVFGSAARVSGSYNDESRTVVCQTPTVPSIERVSLELVDGDSPFASKYYMGEYQFGYPAESMSLSPTSATRNMKLQVRVFGANYLDTADLTCIIDHKMPVPAKWLSRNLVLCIVEQSLLAEKPSISVQVSNNGIDLESVAQRPRLTVSLTNDILISDYFPKSGFVLGGDEILLQLEYPISVELFCEFNGFRISSFFIDSNTIVCTAPSHQPGNVLVNLLDTSGVLFDSFQYQYYELPTFYLSSTNAILRRIPSDITFTGKNLGNYLTGKLVDNSGNVVHENCAGHEDSTFSCKQVLYTGEDNLLSLSVTSNAVEYHENITLVPVFTPSVVLWTDPLYVLVQGEGELTIGFDQIYSGSAVNCLFEVDGVTVSVFPELHSASLMKCKLPPLKDTTEGITFSISQWRNTIYGPVPVAIIPVPEVEEVTPASTLLGIPQFISVKFAYPVGFFPTPVLLFQENVFNLTLLNHSFAVATITAYQNRPMNELSLFFKEIHGFAAPIAQIAVISYKSDVTVDVDAILPTVPTNITLVSQSCSFNPSFTCELHPGECQVLKVEPCEIVASATSYLGTTEAEFFLCSNAYCSPPVFSSLHPILSSPSVIVVNPSMGPISGGSLVYIYGYGFVQDATTECLFGNLTSPAFVVNNTLIQCYLPESSLIGRVPVKLMRQNVVITPTSAVHFGYIAVLSFIIVNPTTVSAKGGNLLTVKTQSFNVSEAVQCRFNQKFVPAVRIGIDEQYQFNCLSPSFDGVETIEFALAYAGADLSVSANLTVQQETHATYIHPTTFSPFVPLNISVFFDNKLASSNVHCLIDSRFYPVHLMDTVLICEISEGLSADQQHRLKILIDDLEVFLYELTATKRFDILSVFPSSSYTSQSVAVDVKVSNSLAEADYVSCCFGNSHSSAMLVSSSTWRCYTPTFPFGGSIESFSLPVGLAVEDGFCEFSGFSLDFYTPMKVSNQSAFSGLTSGGTSVVLFINWNYTVPFVYCRIGTSVTVGQVLPEGIACTTQNSPPGIFSIDVSINGINFLPTGASFEFVSAEAGEVLEAPTRLPVIYYLSQYSFPSSLQLSVDVFGLNFGPESSCFMDSSLQLETVLVDETHLKCYLPVHSPGTSRITVVNNGKKSSKPLEIHFSGNPRVSSLLNNVYPSFGPRNTLTVVRVLMEDLETGSGIVKVNETRRRFSAESSTENALATPGMLYCLTGDQWSVAFDIHDNSLNCTIPTSPFVGQISIQIATEKKEIFPGEAYFEYIDDPMIFDIQPKQGTAWTELMVIGKGFSKFDVLSIELGDVSAFCNIVTDSKMVCKVPPLPADDYHISLQTNGQHLVPSGLYFHYFAPIKLQKLWPLNGPAMKGGTLISITGENFPNTIDLFCLMDTVMLPAVYINSSLIQCSTRPHRPGMVNVAVILDGILLHPPDKALNFLFTSDVSVDLIFPNVGYTAGEFPILVFGSNFLNTTSLGCQFADMKSRGVFLSNSSLMCLLPSPLGRTALFDLSNVTVEVTVNGYDYSDSGVIFSYSQPCDQGFFCPGLNRQLCPNGTYCPENSRNFTLCPPGSFQPMQGQTGCVTCPVGYICPDLGMPRPVVCPPGLICDIMGLRASVKQCPAGMYCLNGTKASSAESYDSSGVWISDYVTGVKYFNASSRDWHYNKWPIPAVGKSRPDAPPENSCDGLVCSGGTNNFLAEAPFPCPIGHYCKAGVGNQIPMPKNFSSPQRCYDGFFCPRGSVHPEGAGPCPNGYFCPTQIDAIICPAGHYCPGVGNRDPIECYPGTYNPFEGQANCTVCPSGYICPGWGLLLPEACPQGFVCLGLGLSYPVVVCPQGYRCGEGTRTLDPSDSTPFRPIVCSAGEFCLGGVFSTNVIPWIASSPYGVTHPQECSEGTYCEAGAYLPSGSGLCFVGHYCPPKSSFPTVVPLGNFASGLGSVAATLCFPGTYAPLESSVTCEPCPSGHTCISYGTFIPSICEAGTYRSAVDSVTCTSCPTGTYSYETGSPDLSQCLPCPKGRICPTKKLTNMVTSISCPDGYICGYGTDRSSQFAHLAPAGFHTPLATSPEQQYDKTCEPGYYCPRGTPTYLQFGAKCTVGYFCPKSSPAAIIADNACPVLTSSLSQSSTLLNCTIKAVDVCDKNYVDPTNPMDDVTYYSSFYYETLDGMANVTLDSSPNSVAPTGELQVPMKIHPVNVSASSPGFLNDTVEAFRTCPLYGTGDGHEKMVVIGRNFIDNKLNYCKFRACFSSNEGRHPRRCKNQVLAASGVELPRVGNVSEQTFITRGKWLSPTRMECLTPKFLLTKNTPNFDKHKYKCLYLNYVGQEQLGEGSGNLSYVRSCEGKPCIGPERKDKNLNGIGEEFFNTLTLPCTSEEIDLGLCSHMPELNYMFNPCMSGEAIVEVTNDGETYSGGVELQGTSILSTSRFGDGRPLYENFKNYTIISTFAVFTFVEPGYYYENPDIMRMERKYCDLPRFSEESVRKRELGWYQLKSHDIALMSFDFTRIPSSMLYAQHYRIAIFAIPSRCKAELCSSNRVRLSPQEYVPCVSPMPMSNWFTESGTNNVVTGVVNNISVYALDDLLVKAEIHILYGLHVPYAPLFENTSVVTVVSPSRARSMEGVGISKVQYRPLTKYVSFEQKFVKQSWIWTAVVYQSDANYVSAPLNLPPVYSDYKAGRALLMYNVSDNNPAVPLVYDPLASLQPGVQFWYAPASTPDQSKEQLDAYFETFHDTTYDPVLGYSFNFDTMILPYFPYFSNCYTFDSYIPIWWATEGKECALPDFYPSSWVRYNRPALPDQDDINYAGPFDFFQDPVSEWCERTITCNYEEYLPAPDSTPRWFELSSGSTLFSLIRYPADYYKYTGRQDIGLSPADAGGGAWAKELAILSGDNFIAVSISASAASALPGCSSLCFARSYTLKINYYQEDLYRKRIIIASLIGAAYDFDTDRTDYKLHLSYSALGFMDLIMNFAYDLTIFLIIFVFAGIITIFLAWMGWIMNKQFTTLQNPPSLRISTMLPLIVPSAASGTYMAVILIWFLTAMGNYFINGLFFTNPNSPLESEFGKQFLDKYPLTYNQLGTPVLATAMQNMRYARVGSMFFILGFFCFLAGSRAYFPRPESKREREIAEKRTPVAKKEELWNPVLWKKLNLILWSFIIATICVCLIELSIFWGEFGTFFYQVLVVAILIGEAIRETTGYFLSDKLLVEPIAACWGFTYGLICFGAPNFYQFILSNIFDFTVTTFQRIYQDVYIGFVFDAVKTVGTFIVEILRKNLPRYINPFPPDTKKPVQEDQDMQDYKKRAVEGVGDGEDENESVEPILEYFADICGDTCITYYFPYFVYLLMLYRIAIQIPVQYGIRQSDMVIYMFYQLFLILFQPIVDCLNHSQVELFRGWKVYEYLVYSRYRFIQRETRWKGLEITLDECIEESLRRLDQMCFSSQYFFMLTLQMNGMIYIILGYEVWLRYNYSFFSDSGFFPLLGFLLGCYIGLEYVIFRVVARFGIWRIKHEGTAWHIIQKGEETELDVPAWEEIKGASTEAFIMNQRITSETFRYKFLNYNRTWLINQLPQILTPRTLRRSRPYLINQFARIINARREDISDDEEAEDQEIKEKKFGPVALTTASRNIIRHWLGLGRRRLNMRNTIEPLIKRARGAQCEQCLSRKQLQIEYEVELDKMMELYDRTYPGDAEGKKPIRFVIHCF